MGDDSTGRTGVRRICGVTLVAVVAWTCAATHEARAAATLPPGFKETTVLTGLSRPTAAVLALDGRIFIAEKSGLIKVYDSFSDTMPDVFADLRTDVYNYWDRGLMSIAIDPQFPTRPYVYALYARDADIGGVSPKWGQPGRSDDPCPDPPGITGEGCVVSGRLVRLTAFGNHSTETKVLVDGWCQQFGSHSLGSIQFGADGYLYASGGEGANYDFADYGQMGQPLNPCGDPPAGVGGVQTAPTAEGGALRAQDLRTMGDPVGLSGSVIRVDPDTGEGAPTNPLAASADANARRLIAEGLRNPYRTAMRPGTNELWIDDVGWAKWEELDRVTGGGAMKNFGWPCYEGTVRDYQFDSLDLNICEGLYSEPNAVTMPYAQYNRNDPVVAGDGCPTGSASEAGMAFYPTSGGSYPGEYAGALFWQDYSRQCMWAMEVGPGGVPDPTKVKPFARGLAEPVYLTAGPGGDLYYLDYGGGQAGAGTLRRIQYFSGNTPPTARATATPSGGAVPLTVQFDASTSSDADGDALSYSWDLNGDGVIGDSTAVSPSYTYTTAGTVTVKVVVADARGATASTTVTVSPGNTPPSVTIAAPSAGTTFAVGQTISFSGSATDAQDGALPASALTWTLVLQHCPSVCHRHPIQDYPGVAGGSFTGPDHEYPSYLELTLTATDSSGLKTSKTLRIDPTTATMSFATSPAGLQLVVNGIAGTAPFTRTVILGSTNAISAPSPQNLNDTRYDFGSWNDGGAQTRNVVASSNMTYTATYAPGGPATSANILPNGRFEGSVSGWDGWQSTVTLANDGVDGSGAALVTVDAGATDFSLYPVPIPVQSTTAGAVYSASAWVRSATPGKNTCLRIREQSPAGLVLGSALTCVKAATAWQQFPALGYLAKGGGELDTYVYEDGAVTGDSFEVDGYTLSDGGPSGSDTTPPTVTVSAPSAGARVRGIYYLTADATDDVGIGKVEFLVNGAVVGSDTSAPYSVGWSSTAAADGPISVTARATDTAGNAATSAAVAATVDNTPPETTITGGPTGSVTETTATFAFTASEPSTFLCSLDSATFTACSSPTTYTVGAGNHSFSVYATDTAGNVDQTPATRAWSVATADTTPPDTTITSGPSGTTTSTSATFAFTATESATFQCQLDGGAFTTCVSPQAYSALATGSHTFAVRATDSAGNVDATPATRTWAIGAADTTPPETTIDSGPTGTTTSTSATFAFSSSEAGSRFECRLDASAFAACTSPATYGSLAVGSHTFSVRATDGAGNVDPTPASRTWSISSTAPPTSNLVPNGDFEAGIANWRSWNGTLTLATDGITGPNAARAAVAGSATSYSVFLATRPVSPTTAGTTYTGTAWVRADAPGRRSCVTIREWSSAGAFVGSAMTCVTITTAWQQYPNVTYTTLQSGGQLEIYASQQNAVAGDTFELDGVSLTSGSAPPADTTPPETTITGGPSGTTTATTASFTFTASEAATFGCSLDNGAWATCTSPRDLTGLAAGMHTFQVRATDAAGNTDPSPAARTWTVSAPSDTTPPETTIDSGPSGTTTSTSATFTFSASEPATFECRLEAGTWAACTSPTGWTGFAPGSHTFSVRAIDSAGNVDATPATRTWTVAAPADTTPPETTITGGPSGSVAATDATFTFDSSESGSTFACALDTATFTTCSSPRAYTGLAPGGHTFQVRATDAAGNVDASPAARTWTVQAPPPPPTGNLMTNGSFESGIGTWRSWNGTLALATDGKDGTNAGKATLNAGVTSASIYPSPRPVTSTAAGATYTATAWVRSDTPGRRSCLTIREWSSSGAVLGSSFLCLTASAAWQQYPTVTYTTVGSGGTLEVYGSLQNAVAGESFELDAVVLAKSG